MVCIRPRFLVPLVLSWYSLASGQTNLIPVWTRSLPPGTVQHGAAVGPEGSIYVTAAGPVGVSGYPTASLHALSPVGLIKWSFAPTTGIVSPPSVGPDGTIYFGTRYGEGAMILAVNPDGTERGRFLGIGQEGNISVGPDGRMLATAQGEHLFRLNDGGTFQILYTPTIFLGGTDGAPVVAADGAIYFWDGYSVTALSDEGGIKWGFHEESPLSGVAIGPDATVYVCSGWGQLCALNPDGTPRWCVHLPGQLLSGPTIAADGTLYVPLTLSVNGTTSGQLLRLDRTGRATGTNFFLGSVGTPALAADMTAWVVEGGQRLSLLAGNGEVLGQANVAGCIAAPVIMRDGLVVLTTETNGVISFRGSAASTSGWPMAGRDPARSHRDTSSVAPSGPTTVSATTNNLTDVTVNWTEAPADVVTYEVWRSGNSDITAARKLADYISFPLSFVDTNVAAGAPYYYWVRARNSAGLGAFTGPARGYRSSEGRQSWIWAAAGQGFVPAGIAVSSNDTAYVTANWPWGPAAKLVALTRLGEELWSRDFAQRLGGPPVIDDKGHVLVATLGGDGPGRLIAFEPDGREAWEFSDPCDFYLPVVRPGGDLLLGSTQRGSTSMSRWGANRYILSPDGVVLWALTNHVLSNDPFPGVPPLVVGEQQLWLPSWSGLELFQAGSGPAWSYTPVGGYPSGIAPAPGGGIYVITKTGLYSVRSDGSILWSILDPSFTSGPVLAADGTLYVGTSTNALVALSKQGLFLWAAPAQGAISQPAVVGQDGSIFFGTDTGMFYAAKPDGSSSWNFKLDSGLSAAPTITGEGRVLIGTTNSAVWALRADTGLGNTAWPKFQGDLANRGRAEGRVVAPDDPGGPLALNPGVAVIRPSWSSGSNAWTYEVWRAEGDDFTKAVRLATNVSLAVSCADETTRSGVSYGYWVRSINPQGSSGFIGPLLAQQTNQFWVATLNGVAMAPAVSANGTVYVAADKELTAFTAEGQKLWTYTNGSYFTGAPTVAANGNIIVPSMLNNGSVQALSAEGNVLWTAETGQYPEGDPAIDAYGTIYSFVWPPGTENRLVAIDSAGNKLWTSPVTLSLTGQAGIL